MWPEECGPWCTFKKRWVPVNKIHLKSDPSLIFCLYCVSRETVFPSELNFFFFSSPKNSKIRANFGSRPFAYAEGQAHRNAADLCVDLAEEISANFEALPFAMASDSDNDAGASVTSDSGSHGPPCRIAAVAVAQQRMLTRFSCPL